MGRPNLRLRSEVGRIRTEGQIFRGRWVHVRVGFSNVNRTLISVRRQFGKAVFRNRIRRQIRALCGELLRDQHPGRMLIISVGDRSHGVPFASLRQDLQRAFQALNLL